MAKQDEVTIIIPHLGGSKESEFSLKECLLSLENTVPDIKVIVAINGEACDKFDYDYLWRKNVEWIQIESQGQCKAVNAAVAMTNTSWVMITNDDMVYSPSWWPRLTTTSWGVTTDLPSDVLCISPKLIEPRPGAPTFEVFPAGGAGGDFDRQKWADFCMSDSLNISKGLRTGFNLPFLIRRDLWNLVGGYDTNYDPWGSNSDSDLEYKIKLAGVQPYQNTQAIVYHFSQTSGTFEPKNQSYWQKNFAYFEEKWGFPRTDVGIWEASFDIPEPPIRKFKPEWEGKYVK